MSSTRVAAMPVRANTFAAAARIALRVKWAAITSPVGAGSRGRAAASRLDIGGYTMYTPAMNAMPTTWTSRLRDRFVPRGPAPGSWERLAGMMSAEWLYRDAHYLVAEVELDPAAAARWVPWPLRLATPARAQVFTAFFPH